jgi:hypothetical protein
MKPQKIIFCLLLLATKQLISQIVSIPIGGQQAVLGNISSCYPSNFSSLNNPALLGLNPNKQLAFSHEMPFMQSKLALSALSVQTTIKNIPFGVCLVQSGNEHFKQHLLSVGLAKKLNKNLSIGIALNYLGSSQFQQESLHNLYGSLGVTLQINKQFLLATHLINPTSNAFAREKQQAIGQFFKAGLSYQLSGQINMFFESETAFKNEWMLRFGLMYHLKPQVTFSMGITQNLERFSGGILVKRGRIHWVIGAQIHRILGYSPTTELSYQLP